jgi:ribA/ribD-fused uncharacterized protein
MTDEIRSFDGCFAFLSNFYDAPITIDGKNFATTEHFFQASKTLDPKWFEAIRKARSAGVAKRMGREAPLRKDWESVKVEVMLQGLRAKFALPELKKMLLDTGDAHLVEGTTWHDTTWGICTCSKHGGEGKNMLGQLLMRVRKELQEAG